MGLARFCALQVSPIHQESQKLGFCEIDFSRYADRETCFGGEHIMAGMPRS